MAIRKSSNSGIPFGGTSGRPANPANGQPYFNGDIGRLELYTSATGWQNIVQETPGVSSATGSYIQSNGYGDFTVSGTNFVDGAIAYAVGTNGVEYQATTTTYNSLVQLSVRFSNLSSSYEPYDIKIVNPSNLFGLLPDAFYINESPVWETSAGSIGSAITGQSVNIQLEATDAESNSLTYSLASGSLPGGLSLSSSGLISGTASGDTTQTFNFTVSVSDSYNTAVTRSFSIAYTAIPIITGGTLTSDSTYYYRTFTSSGTLSVSNVPLTADLLIVAGGGGSGRTGGGGGAGGLRGLTAQSFTNGTDYTITVGAGGTGSSLDGGVATNGINSSISATGFTTIAASGGGGGASYYNSGNSIGAAGGSGGGGGTADNTSYTRTGGAGNVGSYSPAEGYAGGTAANNRGGGGGGGASNAGQNAPSTGNGGAGGNGSSAYSSWGSVTSTGQNINGTYYYAGGGGGSGSNNAGAGGFGGGGAGGTYSSASTSPGTANTGGGAGSINDRNGSQGGSGIVIIRYTKASVGG